MSRMFFTNQEHFEYLSHLLALQPKQVIISTFGIYASILDDGRDMLPRADLDGRLTRNFIESLRSVPEVRMLVGLMKYLTPMPSPRTCLQCESKYVKTHVRLVNHAEKWPNYTWRFAHDHHIKATLCVYDDHIEGVAGSRNLTGSNWDDLTFELTLAQARELHMRLGKVWHTALPIDSPSIQADLERQNVRMESVLQAGTP